MYKATIKTGHLISEIIVKASSLTLAIGIIASSYYNSFIISCERV